MASSQFRPRRVPSGLSPYRAGNAGAVASRNGNPANLSAPVVWAKGKLVLARDWLFQDLPAHHACLMPTRYR